MTIEIKDLGSDAKQATQLKQATLSGYSPKKKPSAPSAEPAMETQKAMNANERLKVDEIVERVKRSTKPYFRPDTAILVDCPPSLLRCIRACWNEQPESRPTMRLINRQLRSFCAGL